jgi:hypothetical protein
LILLCKTIVPVLLIYIIISWGLTPPVSSKKEEGEGEALK